MLLPMERKLELLDMSDTDDNPRKIKEIDNKKLKVFSLKVLIKVPIIVTN